MARKSDTRKKLRQGVQTMLTGRGISSKFFMRNFFVTGLVLIFGVSIVALRFDCVTSMERIKNLQSQIAVMQTYKQRERSQYMTMTRESAMQHKVDSLGLGLTVPEQYPYTVKYEK